MDYTQTYRYGAGRHTWDLPPQWWNGYLRVGDVCITDVEQGLTLTDGCRWDLHVCPGNHVGQNVPSALHLSHLQSRFQIPSRLLVRRVLSHSMVDGDLASDYFLVSSHQSELGCSALSQTEHALLAESIRRREYSRILQHLFRRYASDPTHSRLMDFANVHRQET